MARTETSPTGACFGDVLDEKVVGVVDSKRDKWLGVFMPALRTFHQLFSTTDVPEDFVVPHSSPSWPERTWGLHLGEIICRASDTKRIYSAQLKDSQQELQQLGFTWTATNAADRAWKTQVLPALKTFGQEFGRCNVRREFVIPEQAPWPQSTWGLNLGAIAKRIRAGRSYEQQAERDSEALEQLGFVRDPLDLEWQERILPALVTFVDEFGEEDPVTLNFVVPSEIPWSKETWGLELGSFLCDSKSRDKYFAQIGRDAHLLEQLGFEVELSDTMWEDQISPLLTIFAEVFPSKERVPDDFVVPRQLPWPQKAWGIKLGLIGAQNAKRLDEWKKRKASALASPLNLHDSTTQFWDSRIFPALAVFVKVYGDYHLGEHFTVPSQAPWPEASWRLELGGIITDYCKNGKYFEQIGRDADQLSELGYTFKLSLAAWKACGVPLIRTFSTMYPCKLVPNNFIIPRNASWQDNEWGIKLGMIVRWNSRHVIAIEQELRVQVLSAVDVFHREKGDIAIGQTFIIPSEFPWPNMTWGMDLALILNHLHLGEHYSGHVALASKYVAKLVPALRKHKDETWRKIFYSIQEFVKKFGHCMIKPDFVVPSTPAWSFRDLQLGEIVVQMKKSGVFFACVGRYAKLLSSLGFELAFSSGPWEEKVAPLIAKFADLYPTKRIPIDFVLPHQEPWPENAWGVYLGAIVRWNSGRVKAIEYDWRVQVLRAMEVFRYEYGNQSLANTFVVPSRPPWPEKTWGRELEGILTRVHAGHHYDGHGALVKFHSGGIGGLSDYMDKQWATVILPSLHIFAMVFGHCTVADDFAVPSQLPWPKKAWRLSLGCIVSTMEKHGYYFAQIGRNADRLDSIGFKLQLTDSPWRKYVSPLLATFASQFSHEIVPEDFVVPAKERWSKEFWGVKLGKIISWSSRFIWQCQDKRWKERAMLEDNTLAGKFGHCRIPADFIVPFELPWPKKMRCRKFGDILFDMRQSGHLFIPGEPNSAFSNKRVYGFVFKMSADSSEYFEDPEGTESASESKQYCQHAEQEQGYLHERQQSKQYLGKRRDVPSCERALPKKKIGIYSPRARRERVERFLEKRQKRVWRREVKYDVRKSFADVRLRVRGRFVSREDEKLLRELLSFT